MAGKHPYHRGALRPVELAMLERVLEDACRLRQTARDSDAATAMALQLFALFNAGMIEELDLRNAIAFRIPHSE